MICRCMWSNCSATSASIDTPAAPSDPTVADPAVMRRLAVLNTRLAVFNTLAFSASAMILSFSALIFSSSASDISPTGAYIAPSILPALVVPRRLRAARADTDPVFAVRTFLRLTEKLKSSPVLILENNTLRRKCADVAFSSARVYAARVACTQWSGWTDATTSNSLALRAGTHARETEPQL